MICFTVHEIPATVKSDLFAHASATTDIKTPTLAFSDIGKATKAKPCDVASAAKRQHGRKPSQEPLNENAGTN
jgi:hypothetical protein